MDYKNNPLLKQQISVVIISGNGRERFYLGQSFLSLLLASTTMKPCYNKPGLSYLPHSYLIHSNNCFIFEGN